MRFTLKDITICSSKKPGFNYKNNHKNCKLANFKLDIINEINVRLLIVISYISSELELINFESI